MPSSEEIIDQVIMLPREQQVEIVDMIVSHLDTEGFHPSVAQEWIDEIRRRVALSRSRHLEGKPWEEVRDDIRRHLADGRNT